MKPTLYVYLIRHGQSEANVGGFYSGSGQTPLSPQGFEDAKHAGELLQNVSFAKIFTSAQRRAQQTCETALPGASYEVDAALNEMDVGTLMGMMPADAEERFGETHRWARAYNDFRAFDGEFSEAQYARMAGFMRRLEHSGIAGNVALFCHAGTIVMALDYVMGSSTARTHAIVDNGSVSIVAWNGEYWRLEKWNMT